jgi:hypothetical protein
VIKSTTFANPGIPISNTTSSLCLGTDSSKPTPDTNECFIGLEKVQSEINNLAKQNKSTEMVGGKQQQEELCRASAVKMLEQ